MKVGIMTLGCKVNLYESEFVKAEFLKNNYEIADFSDICDVYIINTCSVTNTSDIKSKKMIRQAIRRNKDACVVALGCFIEANHDYQEDGLDIVIGNKDKSKIVELVEDYFNKKEQIRNLYEEEYEDFEDMFIDDFHDRTRAFVKIQDGCQNYCSYCIIPYVRGKCRSKDSTKVIEEITTLVNNGFKEVVLTGIHTGNYGSDIDDSFSNLLKRICKIDGLKRLRISSIEVNELTDEVLEVIKNNDIIVNHLHIPLQSGCNKILKIMNRKYNLDYFIKKIEKIREIRKDIAITTDIIVGHPYEDDSDFSETINTCEKLEFAKIHVFPYSKRKHTLSADMPQVDEEVKKKRAHELLLVSKKIENAYLDKFIGKKASVLIEKNDDNYSVGHTGNYIKVIINKKLPKNSFYETTIINIKDQIAYGD